MFYFGQWQFAFQPPQPSTQTAPPANIGARIEDLRFNYTETGQAQLDGWWLPADAGASHADAVLLLCHNGATSLPQNLSLLQNLHSQGINVFAFDYRGFGTSLPIHPSEQSVYADGVAALRYLRDTRHIPVNKLVIYGDGIGAAVAVEVARQVPRASDPVAGIILENAQPSLLPRMQAEPRLRLLPVRLLLHDRFDIQDSLAALQTPKLFLIVGGSPATEEFALYTHSAQPKHSVRLQTERSADWSAAITKFLQNTLR